MCAHLQDVSFNYKKVTKAEQLSQCTSGKLLTASASVQL